MRKKGQGDFTRRIFYRMFVPSLLSAIILSIGNIIDALAVGIRMSETGLAAISLVTPIFMVFNVFDIAISVGGSVIFSRLLGEGKIEEAVESFNQMLFASIAISFLIAVAGSIWIEPVLKILGTGPEDGELYRMTYIYAEILIGSAPLSFLNFLFYYYIRTDDAAPLAAFGFAFGSGVDIVLSIVFVLFCGWGVSGAIWSSVIGKICSILIYLPHFFKKNSIIRFRLIVPDMRHIAAAFLSGFSSSSQYAFQFICLTVLNHLMMGIGGGLAVAVFDVMTNVSYVVLSVYDGTASAVQFLTATFYGEKNQRAEGCCLKLSLFWGIGIGVLGAIAAAVLAEPICRLFGLTEALKWGVNAVRAFAAGSVFAGVSMIGISYFQARMEERAAFFLGFLRSFAVYLVCAFLFFHLPRMYFFWFLPASELISFCIWMGAVYIRKGYRRKEEQDKERVLHIDLSFRHGEAYSLQPSCKENFESGMAKIAEALERIEEFTERWEATRQKNYYVRMAVEEICTAIIGEGLKDDPNGCLELTVIALLDGDFEIHIRDSARRFNPFEKKTARVFSEEFDIASVGILMVKEKAKKFSYRTLQGFNTIIIRV